MANGDEVRAALRWQGDICRKAGSPATGRVCDALAAVIDETTETGRRTLAWEGDAVEDALPLRLAGALHALHRSGRAPELGAVYSGDGGEAGVAAAVTAHDSEIAGWLDGPPQTNEPGRSAVLMAGLLAIAATYPGITGFEILEIGSSAGLNLMLGRYGYDLGGVEVGPEEAPIHLAPQWRGPPPPAERRWIESTRGCDVAPIDLAAPGAAERLLAYVWADQGERLARTATAIDMARERPPRLDRGDAAAWLKERLKEPQAEGTARVLMHSVVWPYLPQATRLKIEALMTSNRGKATPTRPLCWLAYEWPARGHGAHELRLRSWPGMGLERVLAYAHPHGTWIDWLTTSPRAR